MVITRVQLCILAELILQPYRHFTYVKAHCPTLPSLYLRHELILQPFRFVNSLFLRSGLVGGVAAIQKDGPGSIPASVIHFNIYPGTGRFFFSVLSCVVCDILLTTDVGRLTFVHLCVLVHSLCFPYSHLTHGYFKCKSGRVKILHGG